MHIQPPARSCSEAEHRFSSMLHHQVTTCFGSLSSPTPYLVSILQAGVDIFMLNVCGSDFPRATNASEIPHVIVVKRATQATASLYSEKEAEVQKQHHMISEEGHEREREGSTMTGMDLELNILEPHHNRRSGQQLPGLPPLASKLFLKLPAVTVARWHCTGQYLCSCNHKGNKQNRGPRTPKHRGPKDTLRSISILHLDT